MSGNTPHGSPRHLARSLSFGLLLLLPGCGLLGNWKSDEKALAKELQGLKTWKSTQNRRIEDLSEQIDRLKERSHVQERRLRRQKETMDALSSWTMENLLALQRELVGLNQGGVRASVETVLQERLRETESRIREQAFQAYATPLFEELDLDEARREEVLSELSQHSDRLRKLVESDVAGERENLDVSVQRELQITEDRLAALLSSAQMDTYRSFRKERGLWPPLPSAEASQVTSR